ncbi:hypothetical protein DN752_18730 [Echinicola strongylocentroti]|uniref:Toxin-antitoxin system YwqK family antitoxin n=1 Tax=Echinicola strongylocentroti TaxID=1795355 RepID=A0A2Z4IMQ1_9BACT|nr:hypothetical protein [Echinicola strongylocentroti]AWW32007.1 hypothetical protein DN752_18730 [Echinicola strongylocentroti]
MKIYIMIIVVFFAMERTIAQQDTTWFDSDWKETDKGGASFYRPTPQPKDEGYWMVDYFASGAKQMEGLSLSQDQEVFEGTVEWYHENGQLKQKANYEMGVLIGEFVTYYNGKAYATAQYVDGRVSNGKLLTFIESYQCYRLLEYQDGNPIHEKLFLEMPEKGMIEDSRMVKGESGNILKINYFDGKGNALGELQMDADNTQDISTYDGVQVNYFYDPLMKKREVSYKHGIFQKGTVWYPSGGIREKIHVDNDTVYTVYFDEEGIELGELVGRQEAGEGWYGLHGVPINGTRINFTESYFHESPSILDIEEFRNGNVIERKEFQENGNLLSVNIYGEKGLEKTVSYDEEGHVEHELVYKGGEPFEGTMVDQQKNVTTTYVQGELTEQISYYGDGAKFESREGDESVFYDRKGDIIGKLTYKEDENGKKKPYNGTFYQLNYKGKLYIEEDYTNGDRSRYAFYNSSIEKGRNSKESETFYDEKGTKTRYKFYYKNGALREDITYARGYEKKDAKFYDNEGDLLGEMAYLPKKHGTEYEFFSDTSVVRHIKKYDESGELVYKKSYAENYTRRDENGNYPMFLEEEIDYNGKARFYDQDGGQLGEAVYKDGAPWTGVVKKGTVYEYRLIPYQFGQKQGEEKLFLNPEGGVPKLIERTSYAEGNRQGKRFTYYRNGQPESEETYSRGRLDGECVYYKKEGGVRNEIVYTAGEPTDGLLVSSDYPGHTKKSFYKSGDLLKIEVWQDKQLLKQMETDDNQLRATVYDTTGIETVIFKVSDVENKTGEVIYNRGDGVVEKGVFKDGLPVSGTFYLSEFMAGYQNSKWDENIAKIKLETTDEEYRVSALNEGGEVLFSVTEMKGLESSYYFEKVLDPYSFYYNVMPEF